MKALLGICGVCLLVSSALAESVDSNLPGLAGTSVYVFETPESTITETGGFAGMHRVYHLQGRFVLTVDPNADTASFSRVEAKAADDGPFQHDLDLDYTLNMAALSGTVREDGTLRFGGTAGDGSGVVITAVVEDATLHLRGDTVPPPQSADFFVYEVEATATRKYAGGTGTPDHPYLIYTAEQLNAIGTQPDDWGQQFQLRADLDLAVCDGKADRPKFCPIGTDCNEAFVGVFDGMGHTVRNLTFRFDGGSGVGLFGFLGPGAEVRNMVIQDANVAGASYVGTLVGYNNGGTVRNCCATGHVTGEQYAGGLIGMCDGGALTERCRSGVHVSGSSLMGGLVGANSRSTITQCSADGIVEGISEGGGIVGEQAFQSLIQDCYTVCTISLGSRRGGIAGRNDGSLVSRCYSASVFRSSADTSAEGGLVGVSLDGQGEVEASFWDMETSGLTTSAGGVGKTTAEMRRADTFLAAGWDFVGETANGSEDLWWIEEGKDYPRLAWERIPAEDLGGTTEGQ